MIIFRYTAWNDWSFSIVPGKFVGSGLGSAHWRIGFWFIKKPGEQFEAAPQA